MLLLGKVRLIKDYKNPAGNVIRRDRTSWIKDPYFKDIVRWFKNRFERKRQDVTLPDLDLPNHSFHLPKKYKNHHFKKIGQTLFKF